VNEYPFIAFAALAASTVLVLAQGGLTSAGGWVLLGVAAATALGLLALLGAPPWPARWCRTRWPTSSETHGEPPTEAAPAEPGPVLIHFHGGHFQIGRKSREARPLLYRLASEGWLCISANYRLRAAGRFPNSLIDAKTVIAWARTHAAEHGADPSLIVVAGGSAGGHLASMAALTPNHPAFQPAGADVDTTVAAAICLYGYYGRRTSGEPASSPEDYLTSEAPPFLVAHGDNDNQIDVSHADHFVKEARRAAAAPVVYFRLPGAQHSFDLFRSLRFDRVVDGIVAFLGRLPTHLAPSQAKPIPTKGSRRAPERPRGSRPGRIR
jgi:acetyl esterase/lipase